MTDRIKWHPSYEGGIEFSARLADRPHDAWARLALVDGQWWWRVIWERRFDRHGHCADRQEASDAANAALQELLATTEEPAPLPMNASPVEARYGVAINPHPERLREDR
jgi:hypothetical protein